MAYTENPLKLSKAKSLKFTVMLYDIKCFCGYMMRLEDNKIYCDNMNCELYKINYDLPKIRLEKSDK